LLHKPEKFAISRAATASLVDEDDLSKNHSIVRLQMQLGLAPFSPVWFPTQPRFTLLPLDFLCTILFFFAHGFVNWQRVEFPDKRRICCPFPDRSSMHFSFGQPSGVARMFW